MTKKERFLHFALATILTSGLSAQTILEDHFDKIGRSAQNPPSSVAFFCSQGPDYLYVSDGSLILVGNSNRFAMAYLSEPGDYITLDVDESIALEITFRATCDPSIDTPWKQLRIGLFNSGDNASSRRATFDDRFGVEVAAHSEYTGYQSTTHLTGRIFNPKLLFKRSSVSPNLFININPDTSGYYRIGQGGEGSVVSGELYTAILSVARLSEREVKVSSAIFPAGSETGTSTSFSCEAQDLSDPVVSFDTIAFGLQASDGSVSELSIESLRVIKTEL